MKCCPTMPVAPRMPTSIRVCISSLPFVDRFPRLRVSCCFGHALFERVGHVDRCRVRSGTARPTGRRTREYRWCTPPRWFRCRRCAFRRSAGISMTSRSSARPSTARRERGLGVGGIAHQPDHDLGAGFIGHHVGRAAAGERADIQGAGPEQRVHRQRDAADFGQRVDELVDGRIAQFRIRRVRHLAGGDHLVAQRALGAQRQLVFGGLAIDDVARSARVLGGVDRRPRCCAPRPPRRAGRSRARPASSSASTALIMEAMMPLVSHAPRPQM